MSVPDCKHRPPCPSSASRWACGRRTWTEDAVERGVITRAAGQQLLQKHGVPMTRASRVMKGDHRLLPSQWQFWVRE